MTQISKIDPVTAYENCCDGIRRSLRSSTPFTYIVYNSLLPKKDEDWVETAQKIVEFFIFRAVIVRLAVCYLSPMWVVLPLLPFVLDGIYLCWRWTAQRIATKQALAQPGIDGIKQLAS